MMSPLLNAQRAAAIIGCTPAYVRMLWDRGVLPCISLPTSKPFRKMRRIAESDLADWIAQLKRPADAGKETS
jgi:hypothetical protein